jgi:hypothetical protein
MSTDDKAAEVVVSNKRGPKPKADKAIPLGEHIADEAKKHRQRKSENTVVEKWYELAGTKLRLCKRVKSGTVHRTLIGDVTEKKSGAQIKAFVDKIKKEGNLRVVV